MDKKGLKREVKIIEILEFVIAGQSYGINVDLIREIIPYQPITPVPNAKPCVEGVFMPRDTMITAVNLGECLKRGEAERKGFFLVTHIRGAQLAFHVEAVLGIQRAGEDEIMKADDSMAGQDAGLSKGVVKSGSKLIILLDFDKIIADINSRI